MKGQFYLIYLLCFLFEESCNSEFTKSSTVKIEKTSADTLSHGYNELANPDNLESFGISDYNTDNPDIKNIQRPQKTIINTQLDTNLIFGIWTVDPEGPHADFQLTGKSFFVVDYDGDGDMPYELQGQKIKIFYNDFIQYGEIISVSNDTLQVLWKDFDIVRDYVRWPKDDSEK